MLCLGSQHLRNQHQDSYSAKSELMWTCAAGSAAANGLSANQAPAAAAAESKPTAELSSGMARPLCAICGYMQHQVA